LLLGIDVLGADLGRQQLLGGILLRVYNDIWHIRALRDTVRGGGGGKRGDGRAGGKRFVSGGKEGLRSSSSISLQYLS